MTQNGLPDIPVDTHGYVTDSKSVGYQILTNYESTYWRALVGSDAWSLYEVLRSFCHQGNKTCRPSIRLLTTILGLEDKRALIGRTKVVKGKEYRYPGLVETLQEYRLVITEPQGEGPQMRYIFHVNLTPGLLTPDQLERLPPILKTKHAELLQRCERALQELDAKKRPSKIKANPDEPGSDDPSRSEGGGKFPPEQHSDITHTTNNHVVVQLTQYGMSESRAHELVREYSPEYITEKIELLEWSREVKRAGRPIQDTAAWLNRACQRDFRPPPEFRTRAQRQRAQEEQSHRAQIVIEEQERGRAEQQRQAKRQEARRRSQLKKKYGTTEHEREVWPEVLAILETSTTGGVYTTWIKPCELLRLGDDTALTGVTSQASKD